MSQASVQPLYEVLRWISLDQLTDLLRPFVDGQGQQRFTMDEALRHGLGLRPEDADRSDRTKVGMALAALGVRRFEVREQSPRFVYRAVPCAVVVA